MRKDGETPPPRVEQTVSEMEVTQEGALQDEVRVRAVQSEIIEVAVHVDLRDGYMMQVMASIDTSSNISFMGQEVLEKLAPHHLQKLVLFARRVQGISGEVVPIK